MTGNEYAMALILGQTVLLWPWAWLLLPLPWLVWRLLPPAPPAPRTALRVPFYEEAVRSGTAVHQRLGDGGAGKLRPWRAGLIWTLLVMAAVRPGWLEPAGELVSLFAWPLGLALGLATLEACRLCRQGGDSTSPRRLRTLPGQAPAGDGHDTGV